MSASTATPTEPFSHPFDPQNPAVQVNVFENGEVTTVVLPDDGFVVVTGPGLFESGRQEFPTTGTVQITFKPVPPVGE